MDSVSDAAAPNILPYTMAPSRRGYRFLALAATWFFPGVGQIVVGYFQRGLIWFAIDVVLQILAFTMMCEGRHLLSGIVLAALSFPLALAIAIDAFIVARRPLRSIFSAAWKRYALGVGFIILGCFGGYLESVFLSPIEYGRVRTYVISSKPMAPTVNPGDRIIVARGADLQRWSIVAYHQPSQSSPLTTVYVTRIVGMPGEVVELTSHGLLVDGKLIQLPENVGPYVQPHIGPKNGCEGNPIHLGPGEYFVLGDNSPIAKDSRYFDDPPQNCQPGAVPAGFVVGVAKAIYWPPSHFEILNP
jgi:signal peptidase I